MKKKKNKIATSESVEKIYLGAKRSSGMLKSVYIERGEFDSGINFRFVENIESGDGKNSLMRLHRAWGCLKSSKSKGAKLLTEMIIVLTHSVPDENYFSEQKSTVEIYEAPEPPKATAANPRAFKGTKYKPPTAKSPPPMDLTQAICEYKNTEKLLKRSWEYLDQAKEKLLEIGLEPYKLEYLSEVSSIDFIWGLYHLQVELKHPRNFLVNNILLALSQVDDNNSSIELIKKINSIDLTEYESAYLCYLFIKFPKTSIVKWSLYLGKMGRDKRNDYLTSLEKYIEFISYPGVCEEEAVIFVSQQDKVNFNYYFSHLELNKRSKDIIDLCRALEDSMATAYSYTSDESKVDIELINDFSLSFKFSVLAIRRMGELCLSHFENIKFIKNLKELNLTKQKNGSLLMILESIEKTFRLNKSEKLIEQCFDFFDIISDEYSRWAANNIVDYFYDLDGDESYEVKSGVFTPLTYFYKNKAHLKSYVYALCFCLFKMQKNKIIQDYDEIPKKWWKQISGKLLNENKADLIVWGLKSLEYNKYPYLKVLFSHPEIFSKFAYVLGSLDVDYRHVVIKKLELHVVDSVGKELIEYVVSEFENELNEYNLIPKKAKQYLNNEINLSDDQVKRLDDLILKEIPALVVLQHKKIIIDEINKKFGLDVSDPLIQHALMMNKDSKENRRSLEKFFKAYSSGKLNHTLDHAKNRNWIKKHPKISLNRWREGFVMKKELKGEEIILEIEKNPFEILKMGTYVGSCFSLGGINSHSPAAVLLDINKQVIFARNLKGKVLARQIVAISSTDYFIPFYVYPGSVSRELEQFFLEYNKIFASMLSLEICHSDEGNNDFVELIVARDWWDDGVWIIDTEDKEAT